MAARCLGGEGGSVRLRNGRVIHRHLDHVRPAHRSTPGSPPRPSRRQCNTLSGPVGTLYCSTSTPHRPGLGVGLSGATPGMQPDRPAGYATTPTVRRIHFTLNDIHTFNIANVSTSLGHECLCTVSLIIFEYLRQYTYHYSR